MIKHEEVTSKELMKLVGVTKDTLKHWRYGYYTDPVKGHVLYRLDGVGVPKLLKKGKGFNFYVYNLEDVFDWIREWAFDSAKKRSLLSKIGAMLYLTKGFYDKR